jgi:acetoacetyl-CoA synthetase
MNEVIWTPEEERVRSSFLWKFSEKIRKNYELRNDSYPALHAWSVDNIESFWRHLWREADFFYEGSAEVVCDPLTMLGASWFPEIRLNFAENLLKFRGESRALLFANEQGLLNEMSFRELFEAVGRVQKGLRDLGVQPGDRVAACLPNIPETVICMLASTSLGAVWSSCSPDFGFQAIVDRFGQIDPKILLVCPKVLYNGKWHDNKEKISGLQKTLKSLEAMILVPYPGEKTEGFPGCRLFEDWQEEAQPLFEKFPFDHPLYIMFSSGTTGRPKCIVHGAGGTLLAHKKEHHFHGDLKKDDLLFYYTTCGWMMWNWLASGLMQGAGLLLYDGSPLVPQVDHLFRLAEKTGVTHFGCSPKYLSSVEKSNYIPGKNFNFDKLRTVFSTGSPLLKENFLWVYQHWKKNLQLASICGGTDIIGCFMLGNPLMPVRMGEIQAPGLALDVRAFDKEGRSLRGEKGELVCCRPFPNRPLSFWKDSDHRKYQKAYFERFPGVWHHGDYISIEPSGGILVYGRSDATLNPGGVRIGTAEIYRPVESLNWVQDSIVVGLPRNGDIEICLFLVSDERLTEEREKEVRLKIRRETSSRHVPAKIFRVAAIPRTISGKKVEKAVLKTLLGEEVDNRESLVNPEVLDAFKNIL